MFPRLVYESFRRQPRRKLLAGVAITLGVAVATAMIAVATDIGDKINRELRSYGANLMVTPEEDTLDVEVGGVNLKPPSDGTFLNEADLPKIRGTFWHNNIVGFSPMLPVTVKLGGGSPAKDVTLVGTYFNKPISFGKEDFATGVRITHPWWKVEGKCGFVPSKSSPRNPATPSKSPVAASPSPAFSLPAPLKTTRSSRRSPSRSRFSANPAPCAVSTSA